MRMLLTLATILAAMLVPWNELAPTWLPDASGSAIEPGSGSDVGRGTGPQARLNAALGIVPVPADEAQGLPAFGDSHKDDAGAAFRALADLAGHTLGGSTASDELSDLPPGVRCENGVCTLPDGSNVAESFVRSVRKGGSDKRVDQAREHLAQLGATQFRIDRDPSDNGFRCSCSVPLRPGSRLSRRFEVAAGSEVDAAQMIVDQIEEWRRERGE